MVKNKVFCDTWVTGVWHDILQSVPTYIVQKNHLGMYYIY